LPLRANRLCLANRANHSQSCRARGLERSTIDAYAQHARLHIELYLGRLKLSQISALGVREFEDRLRLDGRSPAMVRKILTSLGSLLSDAQERGLVSRNVVREIGSRPSTALRIIGVTA
jgi:integrase